MPRLFAGTYDEEARVHLFDVLLGVFPAYLWAPCGDLRFADVRPDVSSVVLTFAPFLS